MSVDRDYRIRISMVTDAGGAKTAAAELGKVGEGAQAAGEGSRKAGEQAEEHHKHLEGLHKICHTLNEVFPGLGAVMQAAFSPVGAAVSIAVMALRYFLEKIKETNEEMKRLEEEAAKPLANRTEALRDQTVRMAVGMADLKEKLDKAKSGEMGLKEQIEHTSEAFKVQSGLAGTLSGALKDNELAHLEARHKAGLVSEEQYVQRKLEIEVNYIRKKRQLEEQAEMTEILLRRRLVAEAEAGALDPNEAEKKKEQAITKLHSLASKESINEAKKQADEALKKWEDKYPEIAEQFRKIGINADPNYAANRATIDANLSAARGGNSSWRVRGAHSANTSKPRRLRLRPRLRRTRHQGITRRRCSRSRLWPSKSGTWSGASLNMAFGRRAAGRWTGFRRTRQPPMRVSIQQRTRVCLASWPEALKRFNTTSRTLSWQSFLRPSAKTTPPWWTPSRIRRAAWCRSFR